MSGARPPESGPEDKTRVARSQIRSAAGETTLGAVMTSDLRERFEGLELAESVDGWPVATVPREAWKDACTWARERGLNFLASLTAVHYVDDGEMHIVAHLYRITRDGRMHERLVLKTVLPDAIGESLPSVGSIWPTALWHEREVYDMFGVRFDGHPDLRRILMEADYDAHPLRKDFVDRKPNLGVSRETLAKDAASNR